MMQMRSSPAGWRRRASVAGLAALMTIGGSMHFVTTEAYVEAVPRFLPLRRELVYVSGVVEMLCGLFLIPRRTRSTAAWLTVAVLVAIFPANLQMALDGPDEGSGFPFDSSVALWLRLPLQAVFIAWALSLTRAKEDHTTEPPQAAGS